MTKNEGLPSDVIAFAVRREVEAHALYSRLRDSVSDSELRALLSGLADDEERHRRLLEERYGPPGQEIIAEAPRLEGFTRTFSGSATVLGILEVAIDAEEKARAFYADYASSLDDPSESKLFAELAVEEEKHRELLATEMKSRKGEPWVSYELDNWVRDD